MAAERGDAWSSIETPADAAGAAAKLDRLGHAASLVRTRQRALQTVGLKAGDIVIDVGAGNGIVTADIARLIAPGGRVFAVDPSAALLEKARAHTHDQGVGHQVDVRIADGRALPFGAAFDVAVCHWVLLHVEEPERVVAEMRRVTRRGGRVLCVEVDWETAMVDPGERAVTRRILTFASDRHIDAWMGRRLPGIFGAAGFSDVVVHPLITIDQGNDDRAWLDWLLEKAGQALAGGAITRTEHVAWTDALEKAFVAGRFFFALVQFAVIGQVPG
jgi:ubiquinone/menaquinone biosynthesis C-methylase UbiE